MIFNHDKDDTLEACGTTRETVQKDLEVIYYDVIDLLEKGEKGAIELTDSEKVSLLVHCTSMFETLVVLKSCAMTHGIFINISGNVSHTIENLFKEAPSDFYKMMSILVVVQATEEARLEEIENKRIAEEAKLNAAANRPKEEGETAEEASPPLEGTN